MPGMRCSQMKLSQASSLPREETISEETLSGFQLSREKTLSEETLSGFQPSQGGNNLRVDTLRLPAFPGKRHLQSGHSGFHPSQGGGTLKGDTFRLSPFQGRRHSQASTLSREEILSEKTLLGFSHSFPREVKISAAKKGMGYMTC